MTFLLDQPADGDQYRCIVRQLQSLTRFGLAQLRLAACDIDAVENGDDLVCGNVIEADDIVANRIGYRDDACGMACQIPVQQLDRKSVV